MAGQTRFPGAVSEALCGPGACAVATCLCFWSLTALSEPASVPEPGIASGTFPLVAFSAGNPTDSNFAEVKRLGFDYVHRYRLGSHADAGFTERYLDTAQRQNLKVMLDVSGFVDPRHSPAKEMTESKRLDALRKGVRRWMKHPAVGFWYVYDEPSPKVMSPTQLRAIHDAVKEESPHIPTAIAQHWGEKWWEYVPCVDIVMPDFYPVRDDPFPENKRLGQMIEFFGKVGSISERTIPIVQCFGFPRLPNKAEVRYMLFGSLTQGIEGMAFWSYWYGRFKPFKIRKKDGTVVPGEYDAAYMRTVYSPVLLELKSLVRSLESAAAPAYVEGAKNCMLEGADLLHGIWGGEDADYIVVVSTRPETRDIDVPFKCGVRPDAALTSWGSTRETDVEIRAGRLRVHGVRPWEVLVWRCE